MSFICLRREGEAAFEIERSRFIGRAVRVRNEEEAKAFLAELRKKESGATHNCFAYVADRAGNLLRFSDDGEPSGTAGMPILEVIRAKKLVETLVAVTRYFGGIKLGAGGLVRAYSRAASEALEAAEVCLYRDAVHLSFQLDYGLHPLFGRQFSGFGCEWTVEFGAQVDYRLWCPADREGEFLSKLADFSLGKAEPELLERAEYPFGEGTGS